MRAIRATETAIAMACAVEACAMPRAVPRAAAHHDRTISPAEAQLALATKGEEAGGADTRLTEAVARAILRASKLHLVAALAAKARIALAFTDYASAMSRAVVQAVGERSDGRAIALAKTRFAHARAVREAFAVAGAVARATSDHKGAVTPGIAKVALAIADHQLGIIRADAVARAVARAAGVRNRAVRALVAALALAHRRATAQIVGADAMPRAVR
mmetsp:Transcript_21526/g.43606  ORF Transcript_21526/g.43606 Transcript_21526/m.43606 type:complete len:217 (+) Transcript_21526:1237-1887(+)